MYTNRYDVINFYKIYYKNGIKSISKKLASISYTSAYFIISASYLLNAMDKTADPCNDFFQYACGDWNKKHVIPEDRTSISTFEVMADQLQVVLKGIVKC